MTMTRAELARALHRIAVELENDADFYVTFGGAVRGRASSAILRQRIFDAVKRDEAQTLKDADHLDGYKAYAGREYLMRYLLMAWDFREPDPAGNERRDYPKFEFWLDKEQWPDQVRAGEAPPAAIYTHPNAPGMQYRKGADGHVEYRPADGTWADCARSPNKTLDDLGRGYVLLDDTQSQPQPQPTEQSTMLKITTKTLLNGKDIAEMTDEQLFDAIASAEAEIEKCQAINAKPKALQAKIEELRGGINALVAHMDAKV